MPRRVLDHYFNVRLGISGCEMELTRTCCFEFDWKRRPGDKVSFLRNIPFYFSLAGFTYLSPLSEVDKTPATMNCLSTLNPRQDETDFKV